MPHPNAVKNTKGAPSLAGVTIVLDAGHVHKDSGTIHHGVKEADFAKDITERVAKELRSRGVNVVVASELAADADKNGTVSNAERARYANQFKNPLLLSFHADSGGGKGTAFYYPTEVKSSVNENSRGWASLLAGAMPKHLLDSRPLRTEKSTNKGANGGLEKSRNMADGGAIVTIETLNLANADDAKKATDPKFKDEYAKAFVDALLSADGSPAALDESGGVSGNLPPADPSARREAAKGQNQTQPTGPSQDKKVQGTALSADILNDPRFDRIASGESGAMFRLGASDPAVVKIKHMVNHWLSTERPGVQLFDVTGPGAAVYDARLKSVIKEFQHQHGISKDIKLFNKGGLQVDGVVGPWTLMALRLNSGFVVPPDQTQAFYSGCAQIWQGGVWVDSVTGDPPKDFRRRLEVLQRWGYDNETFQMIPMTTEEIAANAPPPAIVQAVEDTLEAYDSYTYDYVGSGNNRKLDCSHFATRYLERLGYRFKGRLTTDSIATLGSADGHTGDFINIPLSEVGKPGSPLAAIRVGDMVNFGHKNGRKGHVAICHHLDESGRPVFMESTSRKDDEDGQTGIQVGRSLESFLASAKDRGFDPSTIQIVRPLMVRGEKISNVGLSGSDVAQSPNTPEQQGTVGPSQFGISLFNDPKFRLAAANRTSKFETGGTAGFNDVEMASIENQPGKRLLSVGYNHYIWPADAASEAKYGSSFKGLAAYAKAKGASVPQWILDTDLSPWKSRLEVQQAMNLKGSPDLAAKMTELKTFLGSIQDIQVQYSMERADKAVRNIKAQHPELAGKIDAILSSSEGCYSVLDYVNFKGEGDGYGLLGVLKSMNNPSSPDEAVALFIKSAKDRLSARTDLSNRTKEALYDRVDQYQAPFQF